ncbi:hypothetical protein [Microbacterium sp. Leaf179]|nr:hypothetical protein [Microbacterium sp. Leaf179]
MAAPAMLGTTMTEASPTHPAMIAERIREFFMLTLPDELVP